MQCFLYLILSLIYKNQQKAKTSNKYIVISSLTLLQIQRNLQRSWNYQTAGNTYWRKVQGTFVVYLPLSYYFFSKTYPSFLTIKEEVFSTSPSLLQGELHFLPKPLFLRKRGCNRPTRCSEPLRSKVGGPSKVFARLCGMGPPYYYLAKGAGYYPYFKTTLACNKSQRERNVFNV